MECNEVMRGNMERVGIYGVRILPKHKVAALLEILLKFSVLYN